MHNHVSRTYVCPICLGNQGVESDDTMLKQDDLVFRDDSVSVWISSLWIGKNEGHVLIVPNEHYENLYEIPTAVGHRIFEVSQKMSLALKEAYGCDGITLRQNNEPAGDQHAFHYHLHVFPRYEDDHFNERMTEKSRLASPEERKVYAEKLRVFLRE